MLHIELLIKYIYRGILLGVQTESIVLRKVQLKRKMKARHDSRFYRKKWNHTRQVWAIIFSKTDNLEKWKYFKKHTV